MSKEVRARKAPGSFLSRTSKNCSIAFNGFIKINKIKIIQDVFGKARKLEGLGKRTGEVAVITGAARGIGLEVLKKLLQCDYNVIIGVRDIGAGEKAIQSIRSSGVSTGSTTLFKLDLKSLASVRTFAANVLKETQRIDLLINNAGIMLAPFEETEDGYESHFQVNYLGHFLLTNLLLERIKTTSLKRKTSCRIINVSSAANFAGKLDFTDLEKCKVYCSAQAYADSKFCQVLHAKCLDKRMAAENYKVRAYSLHPGIIYSNLWTYLGRFINLLGSSAENLLRTSEDGANVVMYAALSKDIEEDGGVYINNCKKLKPHSKSDEPNLQNLLWDRSLQLSQIASN